MLVVEGLCVQRGRFVLQDVTFEMASGVVAGLVGPNGAGKTTLMTAIAGLRRAVSGRVVTDAGGVSFVDENPALYAGATVAEHLRFVELACRIRDPAPTKVLVERFQLGPHLNKVDRQLSLGTRRKTSIAMGLLRKADVLVMDEPLNGLDPDAQRELRAIMGEERDAGRSVLVSSHWLPELERVASTYLVLDDGRLHAEGTLDELRQRSGLPPDADLEAVYFATLGRIVDHDPTANIGT